MNVIDLGELRGLDKGLPTDYGTSHQGVIEAENRFIPVTVRLPHDALNAAGVYVFANGWTAGKYSMATAAHEAAAAEFIAVTYDYTNIGTQSAIGKNVLDHIAVTLATPEELDLYSVGESMGGRVVTEALTDDEVRRRTVATTAVAPVGYIFDSSNLLHGSVRLAQTAPEFLKVARHFEQAYKLGASSAYNCMRRMMAVFGGEMFDLLDENIHDVIRHEIKADSDETYLRVLYGSDDRLVPARPLEASLRERLSDLVDYHEPYQGGHVDIAYRPVVMQRVLELDDELPLRDDSHEYSLAS